MRRLDPLLALALAAVARAAAGARDPWWVISSAAAALHGVDGPVGDIDLLMTASDAAALLRANGVVPAPGVPDPLPLGGLWPLAGGRDGGGNDGRVRVTRPGRVAGR